MLKRFKKLNKMSNLSTISHPSKTQTLDLTEAQKLVKEMEIALRGKEHSQWAYGKLNAIGCNAPLWLIIKEIKDDLRDNFCSVAQLIGTDLAHRIEIF